MLGNWFESRKNREKVILATKVGFLPVALGASCGMGRMRGCAQVVLLGCACTVSALWGHAMGECCERFPITANGQQLRSSFGGGSRPPPFHAPLPPCYAHCKEHHQASPHATQAHASTPGTPVASKLSNIQTESALSREIGIPTRLCGHTKQPCGMYSSPMWRVERYPQKPCDMNRRGMHCLDRPTSSTQALWVQG
eukprot:358439-Chlamydomonas_euryale.AAC.8